MNGPGPSGRRPDTTADPSRSPGFGLVTSTTMLLIGAGRVAQRLFDEALAEHGLTLRHIGALGHLAHVPDLSYSDLGRRAGVTAQSMHATIATLIERGAITTADTGRGQRAHLRITGHGSDLLATAAAIARRLDTTWNLQDVDLTDLRQVLLADLRRPRPAP